MSQLSDWQLRRLEAQDMADRSEARRNARLFGRLRRKTLAALNRGENSFRFNRPFSNCYPLPDSVIAECQASLPQGVHLSQRFVPGTYDDDLYIEIKLDSFDGTSLTGE